MKRTHRTVQHKESQPSETKKAQELRKENAKLRREISRLKKELNKRENFMVELEQSSEPVEIDIQIAPDSKEKCPECRFGKVA